MDMIKEEILAMEASPRSNAIIHHQIMHKWLVPIPNYFGNISAAWQVVEKFERIGFWFQITKNVLGERRVSFTLLGNYLGSGIGYEIVAEGEYPLKNIEEAPEAICKAAMLANSRKKVGDGHNPKRC